MINAGELREDAIVFPDEPVGMDEGGTAPEFDEEGNRPEIDDEMSMMQGQNEDEEPPMEGAQRAPDGRWYVQQEGQWFRVDQ